MDTDSTIVIAIATILGPVLAVAATRFVDVWRDRSQRRYQIFVALMATRRQTLNNAHVEALNKIDVEFARDKDVIQALRAYMEELETPVPKDNESFRLLEKRSRRRFAELIQEIGKRLGRRLDKNDFLEGGFYPQGWADYEELQAQNARLLNSLLSQRTSLVVSNLRNLESAAGLVDNGKYPPPPE